MAAEIRPQPGPQEKFLQSSADIVIYGGGAGGGKTFALLMECLRHNVNKDFGAVIFRRQSTQITNEGGLWDAAMRLYPLANGRPFKAPKLGFRFPAGARVTFGHLNQEGTELDWQGSEIPLLCFDELTHFSRSQFIYMLSRNRSLCGVRPYVRATCNPDADSWVAGFIDWWIDQESGLPIKDRSGLLRYFVVIDDRFAWADTQQELAMACGVSESDCKSATFIPASVHDNPALLAIDPGYLANLKAQSRVERERLLYGNWKIRPAAGLYFPRYQANLIDIAPSHMQEVRSWDLAATPPTEANPSPDASAGLKMGKHNGRFIITHAAYLRGNASQVRSAILRTAQQDGPSVSISIPQDPGQAGKDQSQGLVSMLAGYKVIVRRPSHDKITRASPFAAQWQAGNVDVVRGPWTNHLLDELESFPEGHDDQVDALSDAFAELSGQPGPIRIATSGARQAGHFTKGY